MVPLELAPFTGFTKDEVEALCKRYGRSFTRVKEWYEGYLVRSAIPTDSHDEELKTMGKAKEARKYSLYSPLSIVRAMTGGGIKNYWNRSESFEALAEYLQKDYEGLRDAVALLMDGGRLFINTGTYQNDLTTFTGRDDVLSLLVHLGYLGFDEERSEVFIPNRKILQEFKNATTGKEWGQSS